ncbi:FAD-dependent oxidoreductase [Salinibacterium sp. ZJ454]|uniref:FAD-dependent oxidoreductase n=1 Tax=Salinibacterium sp. ZJ454 TaxID=2708339 RepID=UPI0014246F67|nr:FAD-dependent oxidoreductase [Salinibacterium sp. ZJ454]
MNGTGLVAWLDRQLGRVSMYVLITAALTVLVLAAMLLALTGQLGFEPVSLLTSVVVSLAATVASGWLFARLFRARAHLLSSVITALLLFFLFFPSTSPDQLGSLALAGVIASASKFMLAWRGRHIVNPAAIGALVVTLTELNASVWWVATPWLLPVTAIGAFLILWRTRKVTVGVVFVVVAVAVIVIRLVAFGLDPVSAIGSAFTSFPVVFLAGFMLSEPLTLPPRRWQQLLVAVVTALLFSIPFQIGSMYSTPELALVIGNLIAFGFGQRGGLPLEYLGRQQLTPTAWEFSFAPRQPARFLPGQYVELTLPHRADLRGSRRPFSITSATPDRLTIGVRFSQPSSSFKLALLDLVPGQTVQATSIGGDFVLPHDPSTKLLLLAGGIGITPFVGQLAGSSGRDAVLVYSVSSPDELAFAPRLAASGARVLVVAPETFPALPDGWEYLDSGHLTAERLLAAVPDAAERTAFVSGSPNFVNGVRATLRAARVQRIRTDLFSGY